MSNGSLVIANDGHPSPMTNHQLPKQKGRDARKLTRSHSLFIRQPTRRNELFTRRHGGLCSIFQRRTATQSTSCSAKAPTRVGAQARPSTSSARRSIHELLICNWSCRPNPKKGVSRTRRATQSSARTGAAIQLNSNGSDSHIPRRLILSEKVTSVWAVTCGCNC